ncbi:MAG: class I SAM-dependent methyltransferase [Rhodobacteraceae bacterium]|jgi:predicted O-methyltransferase YrrM|nr:class I SAM-dependent methyltransferase [Paracoccaceae bacterium]
MAAAAPGTPAPPPNAVPFADPAEFTRASHREAWHAETRRFMCNYVAPGGIGAEIGVFWAHFADVLASEFRPARLYLVDPWHKLHGETYPNWGRYTNFGQLTTRETLLQARTLEQRYPGIVKVKVDYGESFLAGMPDGHFDWVYLDAHHAYDMVMADLKAILPKMKSGGVIMGDDYFTDPDSQHAGVKRAVDAFAIEHGLDLVFEKRNQFILRLGAV